MVDSAYFMSHPKTATNILIVGWMFFCFGFLGHASASETPVIIGEATLFWATYLVKSTGTGYSSAAEIVSQWVIMSRPSVEGMRM